MGRIMDDVDMLVSLDEVSGVEAALQADGWRRREELVSGEYALRLKLSHQLLEWFHPELGGVLDLHVGVTGPARSSDPLVAALFAGSLPVQASPFRVPAPADAAVVASLHLARTLDTGSALRDLLDIHLLVNEFTLTWKELHQRAVVLQRTADLKRALRLANAVLGTAPSGYVVLPTNPTTVAAHLPPGPEPESAAVRRRRARIEWWALRHSWRLRMAIGRRRGVTRAVQWWSGRRASVL